MSGRAGASGLDLPPVIGHRGAAAAAPENTLAGMRMARELGARWVEFDIRLSADGQCIALHDDTIDRTSDAAPGIARGHLFGRLTANWRAEVERLGCTTVHCDERRLDRATARAVIADGYPLLAYTVNRPERARELLGWGLSAVFTDCPDRIIADLPAGWKTSPNAQDVHT